MGAIAATLITGGDEQPPPQTTQLASGELPEALKNLFAEYLAEEGYQPAEDAGGEPVPAPGSPQPAPDDVPVDVPVPAPAPAPAAPVPVAPVSTRGGSSLWPAEFIPQPLALPAPLSPLPVPAEPLDLGAVADAAPAALQAAGDTVPAELRALVAPIPAAHDTDTEPDPATLLMDTEPAPVPVRTEKDTRPELIHAGAESVTFAAMEAAAPAPEPEITGPSVTEVSTGDAIVVAAEPEPAKPKKEKKTVRATVSDHADAKKGRLVEDTVTAEAHAEMEPCEVATLVEAESVAG
jgi:hypothetical protein